MTPTLTPVLPRAPGGRDGVFAGSDARCIISTKRIQCPFTRAWSADSERERLFNIFGVELGPSVQGAALGMPRTPREDPGPARKPPESTPRGPLGPGSLGRFLVGLH